MFQDLQTSLPSYMLKPEIVHQQNLVSGTGCGSSNSFNSGFFKFTQKQNTDGLIFDHLRRAAEKRWRIVFKRFENKFSALKKKHTDTLSDAIKRNVGFVTLLLVSTHPEKIAIDVTEDDSVIFTMVYSNGLDAYMEIFFEEGADKPEQLNINIYRNSDPIYSVADDFIKGLDLFFKKFPIQISTPL